LHPGYFSNRILIRIQRDQGQNIMDQGAEAFAMRAGEIDVDLFD
jgi:hypothetical protein